MSIFAKSAGRWIRVSDERLQPVYLLSRTKLSYPRHVVTNDRQWHSTQSECDDLGHAEGDAAVCERG